LKSFAARFNAYALAMHVCVESASSSSSSSSSVGSIQKPLEKKVKNHVDEKNARTAVKSVVIAAKDA